MRSQKLLSCAAVLCLCLFPASYGSAHSPSVSVTMDTTASLPLTEEERVLAKLDGTFDEANLSIGYEYNFNE